MSYPQLGYTCSYTPTGQSTITSPQLLQTSNTSSPATTNITTDIANNILANQQQTHHQNEGTITPCVGESLSPPTCISRPLGSSHIPSPTTPTAVPPTTPGSNINSPQGVYGPTAATTGGLLANYPRFTGLSETMSTLYNTAYATQGYVPFGGDPSAFYSPLGGNNTDAWRNLSVGGSWPYDPTMAAYPYSAGYGSLDVRRKNATREATSTLKAWLYEHIKNPYPTKGEKIMLAIITKMTLTQVSTWFANARRRLKKENKMQWSPRNRTGDDDDDDKDGSDVEDGNCKDSNPGDDKDDDDEDIVVDGCSANDSLRISSPGQKSEGSSCIDLREPSHNQLDISNLNNNILLHNQQHLHPNHHPHLLHHTSLSSLTPSIESNSYLNTSNSSDPLKDPFLLGMPHHHNIKDGVGGGIESNSSQINKPRIWSMADMATPSQPPPTLQADKRSPTAIAQSLINKSGYTAFSSPTAVATNHGHNHPVLNGSYHGLQTAGNAAAAAAAAAATGLSPYRLSSYTHGVLPNFHRPTSINALPASTGCTQRLNNGVLMGAPSLEGSRLVNISSNSLDNTATAFKPVPRRS